jgi:hypothetical protein
MATRAAPRASKEQPADGRGSPLLVVQGESALTPQKRLSTRVAWRSSRSCYARGCAGRQRAFGVQPSPGVCRETLLPPAESRRRAPEPPSTMTPTVWRAKIYSERDDLLEDSLRDAARDYCRRTGVVGVGWGRPEITAPGGAPLQQVLAEIYAKGKDWKSGGDTVRRLAEDVSQDDFVWTRDSVGGYWLGRINGPWHFDASEKATRLSESS